MAKHHVNPNTGNPGICKSAKGKCPFGGDSGDENHYKTAEEANQAAEKLMAEKYSEVNTPYRKKDTSPLDGTNREMQSEIDMDTETALSTMTDRIKNTDLNETYLLARQALENVKDEDDEYTVDILKDNVDTLRNVLVEYLGHNPNVSLDSQETVKMSAVEMDTETALSTMTDRIKNTDLNETYFLARHAAENVKDEDDEYTVDILKDNVDTLRNVLVDYLSQRDFELDAEYGNWGKNQTRGAREDYAQVVKDSGETSTARAEDNTARAIDIREAERRVITDDVASRDWRDRASGRTR